MASNNLSEPAAHEMLQQLLEEDQAQPVRATSEQIRTLRARQHQHRRAQTQRKRAHERGPHTGPQRSWNSAELCLKPPCQISVVNVICEYTSCKNNKKTSRRTVKSSQPREPTPTQAGHVTVLFSISHIGGGAGWVPAREAGFDVPTHVPSVAKRKAVRRIR